MSEEIIIDGVNVAECPFYEYQTSADYEMKYPESGDCEIGMAGYLYEYDRIREELEKECISNPNCNYKQLKRLQKTLKHTENGKKVKAEKLKRIEEIVIHCIQGGFTDEFVQEIFDICREYEEV